MYYPVLIAATHVTELRTVRRTDTGVVFGASTTLSELEDSLKDEIHSQPGDHPSFLVNRLKNIPQS